MSNFLNNKIDNVFFFKKRYLLYSKFIDIYVISSWMFIFIYLDSRIDVRLVIDRKNYNALQRRGVGRDW